MASKAGGNLDLHLDGVALWVLEQLFENFGVHHESVEIVPYGLH